MVGRDRGRRPMCVVKLRNDFIGDAIEGLGKCLPFESSRGKKVGSGLKCFFNFLEGRG